MKSRMQHQGGWAATFVIVGVVLALGLAGGIYYLRTHTGQDVVTTDDQGASSEIEQTLDEATRDNNDASEKEQAPSTDSSSEEQPTAQSNDDAANDQPAEGNTDNEQAALPETGPSGALLQLVAVTALSVSSVAYVRSR